jgi:hypothetical protein
MRGQLPRTALPGTWVNKACLCSGAVQRSPSTVGRMPPDTLRDRGFPKAPRSRRLILRPREVSSLVYLVRGRILAVADNILVEFVVISVDLPEGA